MVQVLTHHGLELSSPTFFIESSLEAFKNHLDRGFGIEFDPHFLKDGTVVVTHDPALDRVSNGKDLRALKDLTYREFEELSFSNGRLGTLDQVLTLIEQSTAPLHAMHLKGIFQKEPHLSYLCNVVRKHPECVDRLLIFDVTPQTAKYLLDVNPHLQLAPSVAHPHDVERYSAYVSNTLLSVQEVFDNRSLFRGVWLDEWDRVGPNGSQKLFYTRELISLFSDMGLIVGLVAPELHGTSPSLLGGGMHEDSHPMSRLFDRVRELLAMKPTLICTDYPNEVASLLIKNT